MCWSSAAVLPASVRRLRLPGAAASYRVMPCCIALGEAAGTAAALGLKSGCEAADVDIPTLRATLIAQGAVIKD